MSSNLSKAIVRLVPAIVAMTLLAGCAKVVDVEGQIDKLRNGDQKEREEAQAELVQAGLSAVKPLTTELRSPDSAVKKSVVRILGLIGERDRKEKILLSKTRNDAIEALIDVALSDDKRSIGPKDDPAYLKDIAAALGAYDDERVAEPLMMMYDEIEDPAVRGQVTASLKAIGYRAATAIDRYRKKAKPGSLLEKGVKKIVGVLSAKLSAQVAQKKRGGFLLLGEDEEWEDTRVESAKALALLGVTKSVHINKLLKTLTSPGENSEMRAAICKAIGDRPMRDIRRPQNRDALREAMKDENALVAVYAARALAKAGDTEAISRLLELSKGEYTEELEGLSEDQRLKKMKTWERDERVKSNEVRVLAAQALGDVGRTAVDQLADRIFDENKNVRWAAVDALGRIGGEVAMGALVTSLISKGELSDITVMAAMWLGQNADRRAIRPLIRMLADSDERVRFTASWALQRLAENDQTADSTRHHLNLALQSAGQGGEGAANPIDEAITQITEEAYKLQRELGAGLGQAIYEKAFAERLKLPQSGGKEKWRVLPAPPQPVKFQGKVIGQVTADCIVDDKIVIQITSVAQLTAAYDAAMRSYLDRLGGDRVGLLINFMRDPLESRKVTRATAQLAEANIYRVAEVLTVVGNESSIRPLCNVVNDPLRDAKLRQAALDAILSIVGRLGPAAAAYKPTMLAAVSAALSSQPVDEEATDAEKTEHAEVRAHAAKTLAALKWPEAKDLLTKAKAAEKDDDAAQAIDDALAKIENNK